MAGGYARKEKGQREKNDGVEGVEVMGGMEEEVQIIKEMRISIQCISHELSSCVLLKSAL